MTEVPSFGAWMVSIVGVVGVGAMFGLVRILLSIKDTVSDVRTDVAVIKTEFKGHGDRLDQLEGDAKESGKRLDQVYHSIRKST